MSRKYILVKALKFPDSPYRFFSSEEQRRFVSNQTLHIKVIYSEVNIIYFIHLCQNHRSDKWYYCLSNQVLIPCGICNLFSQFLLQFSPAYRYPVQSEEMVEQGSLVYNVVHCTGLLNRCAKLYYSLYYFYFRVYTNVQLYRY